MHTAGAPPFLILSGPTASGKTAAALALAKLAPIEIISVDSALIYRGMDIGTAKPTAEEQAQVPHHLIDILDPTESYSAARFVSDTQRLCRDIRARGRHPVLVGGTMLYIKALLEGLVVRPRYGRHPRLSILGPLEARLQRFDVTILGSLNEGTWPGEPAADPWMSRPMRQAFGLPSHERRIGLAAHDIAQALNGQRVVLTRAVKVDGTPTVPSRRPWPTRRRRWRRRSSG